MKDSYDVSFYVDPGSRSGAIAMRKDGELSIHKMPQTPTDIFEFFKSNYQGFRACAYVEDVGGSRIGNSAKSATTFAKHMGHLEGFFIALGIDVVKVTPTKWMSKVTPSRPRGSTPAQVATRKTYIYQKMQERYASIKFPKYAADAMGICCYAEDHC